MMPFDPFAWFYSAIGYLQELWGRLLESLTRRIGESRLFQKVYGIFINVPIKSDQVSPSQFEEPAENSLSDRLTAFLQLFLHALFVQPYYWLIGLLGLSSEWLFSRQWPGIAIFSVPALLMTVLAATTWYGGRIERKVLSAHYFELGVAELEKQENARLAELKARGNENESARPVSQTVKLDSVAEVHSQDPGSNRYEYAELLFHRSLLLNPVNGWRYVLGATLLDNSAFESGRKMLHRIAPDSGSGMPAAHAAVATSLLNEFNRTGNRDLMEPFVHHARIGIKWPNTPKEVLITLSGVYWQQGAKEESLRVLTIAAQRFDGLYSMVLQRAANAGDQSLMQQLKPKAIAELESAVAKDPSNAKLRIMLVQMYETDKEGLALAEAKIREGIEIKSEPILSRALSEIYRIAFVRHLLESPQALADLRLLDMALQSDPSNPLVTDQIASMVNNHQRPSSELTDGLYRILASGAATVSVHAVLAEIQLNQEKPEAALAHLEQVFQLAPHAAKYANLLARLYSSQQRNEEAINVCVQSLSILDKAGVLRERYVDDLLHTAGELFLAVGRNTDAESALENALKANPNRRDTREVLINYYRSTGKAQQAEDHEQLLKDMRESNVNPPPTSS